MPRLMAIQAGPIGAEISIRSSKLREITGSASVLRKLRDVHFRAVIRILS